MKLIKKQIVELQNKGLQPLVLRNGRGFTLLELLISMTLLVVIIVLMMGAMRMSSRSIAAGEKKMESQERFRTVISIINAQIQSQVPLTYEEEGNKKFYFRGGNKTLRFATNYSIWGGLRGYVVSDYRIEADGSGREIMYAGEQVPGVGGRRDTRLLETSAVSFEYWQKDPAEEQGKWVESLTDGFSIPEKIRIHIVQGTKKLSLVYPFRVGGNFVSIQGGAPVTANTAQGTATKAN